MVDQVNGPIEYMGKRTPLEAKVFPSLALEKEFDIKDLCVSKKILGMEIHMDMKYKGLCIMP